MIPLTWRIVFWRSVAALTLLLLVGCGVPFSKVYPVMPNPFQTAGPVTPEGTD